MLQFWESGFEGSSMQDLVERMGISRQSLYDTYGNKRELFESALKRYREDVIEPKIAELLDPSRSPTEAIANHLRSIAEGCSEMPTGCLMVRTATEIPLDDAEIGRLLNQCVGAVFDALVQVFERGQASGEFDRTRSARELASSVIVSGVGLHVMRRLPDHGAAFRPSVDSLVAGLQGRPGTA